MEERFENFSFVDNQSETNTKISEIIRFIAKLELFCSFIIAIAGGFIEKMFNYYHNDFNWWIFLSIFLIGIVNWSLLSAISVIVKAAEKYLSEGNNKDDLN